MTNHQSAEDYLETILMLTERQGKVRSIDVVNELGFTKASVSIAMKKLRENGYIAVDGEGNLTEVCAAPDGVHLSAGNGYGAWVNYLRSHTRYAADSPWTPGSAYASAG